MRKLLFLLAAAALLGSTPAIPQATCPGVNCVFQGQVSIPVDNMVRRTYRAVRANYAAYAAPTDIAQICGNATTTVRVTEVRISGLMTTALNTPITLVKRSTASTTNTSNLTSVPVDSGFAAASTTPVVFTAAPTLGTAISSIASSTYFFGNATTTSSMEQLRWTFGDRPASAVVLRGAAQCLTVNLNNNGNSTVVTGALIYISFEWIEDGS